MVSKHLVVRLAAESDAAVIATMSRDLIEQGLAWSWTPQRVARHIRNRDTLTAIASDGERVIGFAILYMGEEHAHLNLLAVRPSHHRAGVGRSLLAWLKASCLTAGIAVIYCETRTTNVVGRAFYQSFGFSETGVVPRYYAGVEAATCMALRLRTEAPTL
jgi:ribosomal protein S18 acetylase RimI-like enzyme